MTVTKTEGLDILLAEGVRVNSDDIDIIWQAFNQQGKRVGVRDLNWIIALKRHYPQFRYENLPGVMKAASRQYEPLDKIQFRYWLHTLCKPAKASKIIDEFKMRDATTIPADTVRAIAMRCALFPDKPYQPRK